MKYNLTLPQHVGVERRGEHKAHTMRDGNSPLPLTVRSKETNVGTTVSDD